VQHGRQQPQTEALTADIFFSAYLPPWLLYLQRPGQQGSQPRQHPRVVNRLSRRGAWRSALLAGGQQHDSGMRGGKERQQQQRQRQRQRQQQQQQQEEEEEEGLL
jgi:hypothetical protein